MPFPCGQEWTGTTRDSHSPSRYSIDWNRPDDDDDPVVASAPGIVIRAEPTRHERLRPLGACSSTPSASAPSTPT